MAMNRDEMLDEHPGTFAGVSAHSGIAGNRQGAVDQDYRAARKRHRTESRGWEGSADEETVHMPVGEVTDDPALVILVCV